MSSGSIIIEDDLYKELAALIEKSKQKAISQVRSTINLLFWQIGKKINTEILQNKRAEYGSKVVENLSKRLSTQYGRSFELKNLRRMMQFASQFPDKQIVGPLARQLSWSHIIFLLPMSTIEEKMFYAQRVIEGNLS